MKKAFSLMAVAVVAAVCVLGLGSGWGLLWTGVRAEGGTGEITLAEPVESLDIDWEDGSVTVAYHDGDAVEIRETAPKGIPEADALRWELEGTTLRIRYREKKGFSLSSLFTFEGLNKALTVSLPRGTELKGLRIDATSADVTLPEVRAESVEVDLTSGDLSLNQVGRSGSVALSSTSGDLHASLEEAGRVSASGTSGLVELRMSGDAGQVEFKTTSGDILASLRGVDALSADSTSGNIQISLDRAGKLVADSTSGCIALEGGTVDEAALESTSGDVTAALEVFGKLSIETTSGDVTAALRGEPGFQAEIDTTSGSFDSAMALKKEGKSYSCGDGSGSLRIDTTSGNVRLEEPEK